MKDKGHVSVAGTVWRRMELVDLGMLVIAHSVMRSHLRSNARDIDTFHVFSEYLGVWATYFLYFI